MEHVFSPPREPDLGPEIRAFMVKGIRHDGPVRSGLHWAKARRGRVVFHERALMCWDWTVPYERIHEARVEWFRSIFGASPILLITTDEGVRYQFGMNPSSFWKAPDLPFPIEVTDEMHGSAARQWVMRLFLLLCVAFLLLRLFV